MDYQDQISKSKALFNIPEKKLNQKIIELVSECKTCSHKKNSSIENIADGLCQNCALRLIGYNRYSDANIPVEYWTLSMNNFKGPEELKKVYNDIVQDFSRYYISGKAICLAGPHGTGKTTLVANILKKACQKNYSALYTTLSDAVNVLTSASSEDKFLSRRDLTLVDFLVVDEFDPRFASSDNAADLFGRTLEHILRTRIQNQLPIILCSNSPNPQETFNGAIKQSIGSLMNRVKLIPIMGPDFRKTQKE